MKTSELALPLEDNHLDILSKAQHGLKLGDEEIVTRAGISSMEFEQIHAGEIRSEVLVRLAVALNLGPWALTAAAQKTWRPRPVTLTGLKAFTTQFEDMTVNSYLVWDATLKIAAAFDAGADASGMLDFTTVNGLDLKLILITHSHVDHIFDLNRLKKKSGATAWIGDKEPVLADTRPFAAGKTFQVGGLTIKTRLTWGHADGGITYVVSGLTRPVAIVGDAIFAGSMGGGKVAYADALRTTRKEILSLPEETILASGHGPLTTVAEEKEYNPFFAT